MEVLGKWEGLTLEFTCLYTLNYAIVSKTATVSNRVSWAPTMRRA